MRRRGRGSLEGRTRTLPLTPTSALPAAVSCSPESASERVSEIECMSECLYEIECVSDKCVTV